MQKAKGKIRLKVLAGLMGLWLVFMTAFSLWMIRVEKESCIWDVYQLLSVAVDSSTQTIGAYYGKEYADNYVLQVNSSDEMCAELTVDLNLTKAGNEIELAVYDGTPMILAQTGAYLPVSYLLPHRLYGGYKEDQFAVYGEHCTAILDIYDALPEDAAEQLINYCADSDWTGDLTEESGERYTVNFPWFWTNGKNIVPKYVFVYKSAPNTDEFLPSISQNGEILSPGNLDEVWFYENEPAEEQIQGMTLLGNGWTQNLCIPAVGNETPAALTRVTDTDWVWSVMSGETQLEQLTQNLYIESKGFFDVDYYGYYQTRIMKVGKDDIIIPGTWLFFAGECHPLAESTEMILIVGISSLLLFLMVASILIWQLTKIYEKQAELEARRRRTTNAMAHDLKTPMAAITGYADNLLENTRPEKQEKYLRSIYTQVGRMNETVGRMLELSRLEAEADCLNLEEFSLAELCREVVEDDAGSHVRIRLVGDAIIRADRAMLRRVLGNFLSNARKHTLPGDTIEITVEKGKCTVFNPGEQIPPEQIPKLWEAYYQADASRSQGGSGLGLSIVREILTRHGFAYGVENREDGVAFWFAF